MAKKSTTQQRKPYQAIVINSYEFNIYGILWHTGNELRETRAISGAT